MTIRSSAAGLSLLLIAACDLAPAPKAAEEQKASAAAATARQLRRACASEVTFNRLKALAFDDALKVREGGRTTLDALAGASVLRMENPVAKSRDPELNVTVCSGRMVIELPPGTQDAFGGERRLTADVEYSAQEAADGSGLVYQLQGAEPIIYRLAALDLKRSRGDGGEEVAEVVPVAPTSTTAELPTSPTAPTARIVEPRVERRSPVANVERSAGTQPRQQSATAAKAQRQQPATVAKVTRQQPATVAKVQRQQPATVAKVTRAPRAAPDPAARATRAASRPSFDCRSARSRSERMVCSSDALARRDRAMSSEFYAALANADPVTRRELRETRDRFLRYRDRCASEACVADAYADRIEEIRDIRDEF